MSPPYRLAATQRKVCCHFSCSATPPVNFAQYYTAFCDGWRELLFLGMWGVKTIEILIKRETVHRDVKTNRGVASLVRGQTVTDLHGYSAPGHGFRCCVSPWWYNKHQVSQQGSSYWLPAPVMPGNDDMTRGGGSSVATVFICVGKSTLKNKDEMGR